MGRTIKALKRPITTVRQLWEDYQVGRAIRHRTFKNDDKEEEHEEGCDEESQVACSEEGNEKEKEEDNEKFMEGNDEEHEEECMDEALSECEEAPSDLNEDQCMDNKVSSQPVTCSTEKQERATRNSGSSGRKWKFDREAEFPWRHEQLVDEESNWRGTWVLEVKDLRAMNWATEIVVTRNGDKREKKIVRKPTRQLPFPIGQERSLLPSEGGQNSNLLPSEGGQDDLMVWLGKS
ncbi:hypothetical protein GGI42DRAFT_325678 [Trichoderma sp. SZMC 28013]